MAVLSRDSIAPPAHAPAPHLLLSAPNTLTTNRIRAHLAAAEISADPADIGLIVPCAGIDWRTILESIALGLSPAERRDTRVAVIDAPHDPASLHRCLFRARSIEQVLCDARQRWLDELIEQDRIAIHLQPIVQFPPGRILGYECLMRGVDTDGAPIPPLEIFSAARSLDRLPALDRACRRAAVRAAAAVPGSFTFFVNISPSALVNPRRELAEMMRQLQPRALHPRDIALEIVETEQIRDQRELLTVLQYFRKAGFKVALDDVGAGYASLLALSRLRPDYIKIDGELVRLAARSALEAKIVRDLAETARQNNIITIAEGIETPEQFRLAQRSGIRLTQGYFHARPRPAALTPAESQDLLARAAAAASHPAPRAA